MQRYEVINAEIIAQIKSLPRTYSFILNIPKGSQSTIRYSVKNTTSDLTLRSTNYLSVCILRSFQL
jgi:hypothetical protein